jgi:hypothetical protein
MRDERNQYRRRVDSFDRVPILSKWSAEQELKMSFDKEKASGQSATFVFSACFRVLP